MIYVILPTLYIILFFISSVIKRFKNVFINYLAINYIIVYNIIIITDKLDKVSNSMELRVVKYSSTDLRVNWLVLLKYNLFSQVSIRYTLYIVTFYYYIRYFWQKL